MQNIIELIDNIIQELVKLNYFYI